MKSRRYPHRRRAEAATASAESRRGRSSVQHGKEFEQALDQCHHAYRVLGAAMITHAPPRTVGAPGRMRFKEPSDVDYVGHYFGSPVAFDAKGWTNKASYHLPSPTENGGKDLERHLRQVRWLLDFEQLGARSGARSFLLLHCQAMGLCWIVGAPILRHLLHNPLARVPIRTSNRDGTHTHHLPAAHEASVLEIARGKPRWDFLRVAFDDRA